MWPASRTRKDSQLGGLGLTLHTETVRPLVCLCQQAFCQIALVTADVVPGMSMVEMGRGDLTDLLAQRIEDALHGLPVHLGVDIRRNERIRCRAAAIGQSASRAPESIGGLACWTVPGSCGSATGKFFSPDNSMTMLCRH